MIMNWAAENTVDHFANTAQQEHFAATWTPCARATFALISIARTKNWTLEKLASEIMTAKTTHAGFPAWTLAWQNRVARLVNPTASDSTRAGKQNFSVQGNLPARCASLMIPYVQATYVLADFVSISLILGKSAYKVAIVQTRPVRLLSPMQVFQPPAARVP